MVERGQLIELTPQKALALIQISNAGGIRAGAFPKAM